MWSFRLAPEDRKRSAVRERPYRRGVSKVVKAAALGNARAMAGLGFMYESGRGVLKDDAEAVRWYREAADLGDASAVSAISRLYSTRK